jgi:hypothetical protein
MKLRDMINVYYMSGFVQQIHGIVRTVENVAVTTGDNL